MPRLQLTMRTVECLRRRNSIGRIGSRPACGCRTRSANSRQWPGLLSMSIYPEPIPISDTILRCARNSPHRIVVSPIRYGAGHEGDTLMRVSTGLGFALAAILLTSRVLAGDFEDGVTLLSNKDYASARAIFLRAAAQGDPRAQLNLGLIYFNGNGIAQDFKQAVSWYRKAALHGDTKAQYNLGLMYTKGQRVAQDHRQAASWYRKAAAQGGCQGAVQPRSHARQWLGRSA